MTAAWTVVLPLKGGPAAKSRLGGPPGLATAIALDSLDAVLRTPSVAHVVVVTADPGLAEECTSLGAIVIPQSQRASEPAGESGGEPAGGPAPGPAGGLAGAIRDGVSTASGPCAVLLGDVPALRPGDLDEALAAAMTALAAGAGSVFVPDADEVGTVLLAARTPADLRPRFGPGSAAVHRAIGAQALDLDLPRLRRDVDTAADLATALALGAGPRTQAALAALSSPDRSSRAWDH